MSETDQTRTPPEIIRVPPPAGPGVPPKRIRGPVGGCVLGTVACLVLIVARGGTLWQCAIIMTPIYLVVAIIVALRYWQVNAAHQASRRAFLEKHPTDEADRLVAALGKVWTESDRVPKLEDVRAVLGSVENRSGRAPTNEEGSDRATIVCFGEADVPQVGELHFHPEIVTPTAAVWRQLFWLVIAGVLIVWCLLDYLHVLPAWLPGARPFMGGLAYFFVAGAIALAVWIWKGMIRPTYLRMAPGVIQVLEYRFSKSKPTVRSYPMKAGTLAVFTRIRKHLVLTLSRAENQDVLRFSRMQYPKQRIERAWQALLSTAPTPPLSEEELVG